MKRFLAGVLGLLLLAGGAAAQPSPPSSGPFAQNGAQVYPKDPTTCLLFPQSVTGGCVGAGTINAKNILINGVPIQGFGNQAANSVLAGPISGSPGQSQFRSLVGADLPNPSASTLGGIQSTTGASHQWISSISTLGVPGLTQPSASDLAAIAANTVLGNAAGSSATPTTLAVPSCGSSANALKWTSGTGFGCNTLGTVTGPSASVVGNLSSWSNTGGTAIADSGMKVVTLEEQNVSPKCVADGVTDCLPAFNAAMSAFTYSAGTSTSGGQILLNWGNYFVSGPVNMTGKHGLVIQGRGMLNTSVISTGNYPVFKDIGTFASPTNKIEWRDMNITCGGKSNPQAEGIHEEYGNTIRMERLYFNGCNHGVYTAGVFIGYLTDLRWDGLSTQQNNICLYMDAGSDPTDNQHNNALVVTNGVCQSAAQYGARLINAQGSTFANNQWIGTAFTSGIYYCDPASSTFADGTPFVCQFMFSVNDQVDSPTGKGWILHRGLASAMGRDVVLQNPWAGNTATAAIDVDGAFGLRIYNTEIATADTGISVSNTSNSVFTGAIFNYNRNNNGSGSVTFINTTNNNLVNVFTETPNTVIGYNGITESGTFTGNQIYGGPASCGVGLAFGGSATGITYTTGPATTNQCQYEVKGRSVRVQFLIALSNKGSATGAATLTGLPITTGPAVGWGFGGTSLLSASSNFSGLTGSVLAQVSPAGTTAGLFQQGATGAGAITDTNFTNTSTLTGALEYFKQ